MNKSPRGSQAGTAGSIERSTAQPVHDRAQLGRSARARLGNRDHLAALKVAKASESIDQLEAEARHGAQGPRANALWRIGLLGNRGVQPERAFDILMSSIHDENVNVRHWAVEGLAYLGTENIITPLLSVFFTTTPRR